MHIRSACVRMYRENYVTVYTPLPPPMAPVRSLSRYSLYPFPSSFRPFFSVLLVHRFTRSSSINLPPLPPPRRYASPLPYRSTAIFLHPSYVSYLTISRGIRVYRNHERVYVRTRGRADAHSQGLTMYSRIIEFAESTCALLGPRCRPCPIFLRNGRGVK